jgi:hypothetical protein
MTIVHLLDVVQITLLYNFKCKFYDLINTSIVNFYNHIILSSRFCMQIRSACIPTSAFHVVICLHVTLSHLVYSAVKWNPNMAARCTGVCHSGCCSGCRSSRRSPHDSQQHHGDESTHRVRERELYVARPGITNSMNILASGWPQPAHPRLRGHQNWERSRATLWWCVVSICIFNLTWRTSGDQCCLFITAHHVVRIDFTESRAQSWSPAVSAPTSWIKVLARVE